MVYVAAGLALALVLVVRWAAQERAAFLYAFAVEREQWMVERRELLNRIEPATAQYGFGEQVFPEQPIPFDDDDAYQEISSMSKEELAELADRQAAS